MILRKTANRLAYGFNTFVLRRTIPYLLGMVITDKCNLDCFYCESKNSGRYHFSAGAAREILRDAYGRGHRALYFTGGEPMLWSDDGQDLSDLVRFARELGFFDVFIFTNGTLPLSIARCNYIVTIDGPQPVHDAIRAGTFERVIENVRNAVTRAVFASITFSRTNLHCLEEYVEQIASLDLFRGISFNILTHCPEVVAKYGVTGPGRAQLMDRLWSSKKKGYPIVLSRAAYRALRSNRWKRPIPQIELATRDRVFTCCRDVGNPAVCESCGYANCVEVSQILALKPSALMQVLRMV